MTLYSIAMTEVLLLAQSTGFAHSSCDDCGHRFYPPQSFCPTCLSPAVKAVPESAEAIVLSTTRIHRSLDPAVQPRLPLYVACIQTQAAQSLFAMTDSCLPAGTKVRLQARSGVFHAEALP